jgi:hypothetical protein
MTFPASRLVAAFPLLGLFTCAYSFSPNRLEMPAFPGARQREFASESAFRRFKNAVRSFGLAKAAGAKLGRSERSRW